MMIRKWLQPHPPKREKPPRPRGYIARRIGVVIFWVSYGFMFLVVTVTVTTPPAEGIDRPQVVQQEVNPATKPEAIDFARSFAAQYFTWEREKKEEREKRLKWYLAEGLDPYGGLEMENLASDSRYLGSSVKRVEEKGKNRAYITLSVIYEIKGGVSGEGTGKQYVTIPVEYNGTSYGVYELPKFTFIDEQTTVKSEETKKNLKQAESGTARNIRLFLDTFFSSYAEDPRDKLAYILEDKKHLNGLNQSMWFVEVRRADVYEEAKNQYVVVCEVVFQDPTSGARFATNYDLVVEQKDQRYVVRSMESN